MASINIVINSEEKKQMITAIRKSKGSVISVAKLAALAGQNPNRSRFVIEELIEEGKIKRVVAKSFNARYIRYSYEIVK